MKPQFLQKTDFKHAKIPDLYVDMPEMVDSLAVHTSVVLAPSLHLLWARVRFFFVLADNAFDDTVFPITLLEHINIQGVSKFHFSFGTENTEVTISRAQ